MKLEKKIILKKQKKDLIEPKLAYKPTIYLMQPIRFNIF